MRVAIVTLGCKVNQYESRALQEALERRGHLVVPVEGAPDVVIVNSCTVTHRSDRDTRAWVRRARRSRPGVRVVVTGCYAQVDPEALRALGVDAVVGTADRSSVPDLVERGWSGVRVARVDRVRPLEPEPVSRFTGRARAFLKVQDGCEAFCAYCIVPYARGPSRSLPLEDVEAGLVRLREAGHREVVLTGVHLGLWGRDLVPPKSLEDLLAVAERSGVPRIRLSSLEPQEIGEALICRLSRSDVLCPHLHIPLQSGSDRVLAAMGRPYRVGAFRRLVERLARSVPGICLGLDVIVGFPGESEEDFRDTVDLLEALPVAYLHVFPFSPRKGTRAYTMAGRVPEAEVGRRARILRELSARKREAFWKSQRGRILPALAEGGDGEGWLRFRTRNYVPVRVRWVGEPPGHEVRVRLEAVRNGWVEGTVMGPARGG